MKHYHLMELLLLFVKQITFAREIKICLFIQMRKATCALVSTNHSTSKLFRKERQTTEIIISFRFSFINRARKMPMRTCHQIMYFHSCFNFQILVRGSRMTLLQIYIIYVDRQCFVPERNSTSNVENENEK